MISKEDFNKVWKDSTREVILNQFYYDYIELRKVYSIIKEVREYHDNCVNNLLDIEKIDEPQKLAYQVAYEIHKNYLEILERVNNDK